MREHEVTRLDYVVSTLALSGGVVESLVGGRGATGFASSSFFETRVDSKGPNWLCSEKKFWRASSCRSINLGFVQHGSDPEREHDDEKTSKLAKGSTPSYLYEPRAPKGLLDVTTRTEFSLRGA